MLWLFLEMYIFQRRCVHVCNFLNGQMTKNKKYEKSKSPTLHILNYMQLSLSL